jgi:hypothetical protein
VVEKIIIFYSDEGTPVLQSVLGFYWLGSVFSGCVLLYTYRRTMRHRLAKVPWKLPVQFYLDILRNGGIALLTGMVAMCLAAIIVDWEVVLAVTVLVLPLLISLLLYYLVLTLTGSRVYSLFAFFVLPILVGGLCIVQLFYESQTIT